MSFPVLLLLFTATFLFAQDGYERLIQDLLILDAHIDTPRYCVDEGYRLGDEHGYYELDIPRMRKGRLGGVFFGIYAQPQDYSPHLWRPRALECLDALHREVSANPKEIEFAISAADVQRIHRSGRRAALASLEGGHLISNSLAVLRLLHRLGVRYMTLAHFQSNSYTDSMTDVAVHEGLSEADRVLLKHIDHVAKLAGPDHVALGSDYDGISGMTPTGMEDVSKYPLLVRGLLEMGYTDQEIRNIMGLNLLRVMRASEELARRQ